MASLKEGTLSLFTSLKILETPATLLPLEILSLGEPVLCMSEAISLRYWSSKERERQRDRQTERQTERKERRDRMRAGYPVHSFSLSSASSLPLWESSTIFHHLDSQLTSDDSLSPEILTLG